MIDKIEKGIGGVKGKTLAVLGLSFKPNTDDMRDSPSLAICKGLVERRASLRIWDPAEMKEAGWRLKAIREKTCFASDEYDALTGADAVVILTEWNQFRNLDLGLVKQRLKSPIFFDLRNIYRRETLEGMGFRYFGVGQ